MATMVPNQILQRMARGEKALGMTLRETSGLLVELAGRCGLDFVSFDAQHDTVSPAEIGEMCRIADAYGMTVSMRIPDGAESTILSYLDRGVRVITVPNLLTAEQARDLVKYSFFAPLGLRSATSIATMHGQVDGDHVRLFQEVNANTVIVPQLESIVALENLDEILAVDGIDYFGAGAEDMAQSLGTARRTAASAREGDLRQDQREAARGRQADVGRAGRRLLGVRPDQGRDCRVAAEARPADQAGLVAAQVEH